MRFISTELSPFGIFGKPLVGFFLVLSICSSSAVIADETFVLEGKIEHSSSLPPVAQEWKQGSRFDPAKLPLTGSQSCIWWRVPYWLAGTWHNSGKVKRLSFKDFQHPDSKQGFDSIAVNYPDSEVIGYQKDKEGVVWTCVPAPYVGRSEQSGNWNISIIHSAVPMELSDKEVVLRFVATTLTVSQKSRKILSVVQRESLQTYRPIEHGRVLVQASMQFYDQDGMARYESKVMSQARLEDVYKETAYLPAPSRPLTLIDMRSSFDNFLRSRNLDYLIPQRSPVAPEKGYRVIVI